MMRLMKKLGDGDTDEETYKETEWRWDLSRDWMMRKLTKRLGDEETNE